MTALEYFLKENITNNDECTHVSLKGGKYSIKDKYRLIKLLSMYAFNDKICLAEIPPKNNITQIKIDLDFRSNSSDRLYNKDFIEEFVKIYNSIIKKYLRVKENDLKAFIFERPHPYVKNGSYKDGLHIMYPYIICNVKLQRKMRSDAIVLCDSLISTLKCTLSIKDIIDVTDKNPWLMYGCSKVNADPYMLKNIINDNNTYESINISTLDLIGLLSIRDHDESELCPIKDVILEEELENEINKVIYKL